MTEAEEAIVMGYLAACMLFCPIAWSHRLDDYFCMKCFRGPWEALAIHVTRPVSRGG